MSKELEACKKYVIYTAVDGTMYQFQMFSDGSRMVWYLFYVIILKFWSSRLVPHVASLLDFCK